jgi:hypothetical protein
MATEPPWRLPFRSTIRQGDIEFQNRAAAVVFQGDMHVIVTDIDVLANSSFCKAGR